MQSDVISITKGWGCPISIKKWYVALEWLKTKMNGKCIVVCTLAILLPAKFSQSSNLIAKLSMA